jgi:HTH-type transcriptional regulator/antitoxin HipB
MQKIDQIQALGQIVKKVRKEQGLTQTELSLASGAGLRFIVELEAGKPTLQINKVFTVLKTLGITFLIEEPNEEEES